MQHPFEGILEPEQNLGSSGETRSRPVANHARRTFLQRAILAVGGLLGISAAGSAAGQEYQRRWATTLALGEEGGGYPPRSRPPYRERPRYRPPRYTTYALGEEGGYYPRPPRGRYTTQALGEEGGMVTTYALGEEG